MTARPARLDSYSGTERVGSLHDTDPPAFAYADPAGWRDTRISVAGAQDKAAIAIF